MNRYILLIILNIPIILIAITNIVTRYKLKDISARRMQWQLIIWLFIIIVITSSFPIFNFLNNRPPFDASELSLIDIVQSTAIIYLFYIINQQRQKIDRTEKTLRDLHKELSIRLSRKK